MLQLGMVPLLGRRLHCLLLELRCTIQHTLHVSCIFVRREKNCELHSEQDTENQSTINDNYGASGTMGVNATRPSATHKCKKNTSER